MSLLTLPNEILHHIFHFVPPNWETGRPEKPTPDTIPTSTDLFWFLSLRLIGKPIDDVIIDHFMTVIRAGKLGRKLTIRRGPPTPSTLAMGTYLVKCLARNCNYGPRSKSPYAFVNTLIQGVEGAVRLFSQEDANTIRNSYTDALASTLVAHLGTGLIIGILSGGDDLDNPDQEEWRGAALMAAAYLGRIDHMEKLVAGGADIHFDPDGKWIFPPLFAAAFAGQMDVLRILAKQGFPLDSRTVGNGENAIHFAVLGGHVETVRFLIESGVEAGAVNNDGDSPLHWAAGGGHAEVVAVLIAQEEVDVNRKDRLGRAPLIWAIDRGYTNVYIEMLEERKDIDLSTIDGDGYRDGVTPVVLAGARGREFMFEHLCQLDSFDADDLDLFRGFTDYILSGSIAVVELALEINSQLLHNWTFFDQWPPLLAVAADGTEEMLRYIISRDTTPISHVYGDDHDTALRLAVISRDHGKVKAILEQPSLDINQLTVYDVDQAGTILHYCSYIDLEDREILKLLLAHPNLDVNAEDGFGATIYATAAKNGNLELFKLLFERTDVDKHIVDNYGDTPLLLAAQAGHTAIVKTLITVPGTDIWKTDSDEMNPITYAASGGHLEMVKTLLDPRLEVSRDDVGTAVEEAKEALQHIRDIDESKRNAWNKICIPNLEEIIKILSEKLKTMN
ncbi:ankyrin repeat-containing domain protein [Aspergillus californicus]